MASGFRSDQALALYNEAIRQGWRQPHGHSGSGHAYLYCSHRRCHYRAAFSKSGRYYGKELLNQITMMRKHGLTWGDRPGKHTAPLLNARLTTPD